MTSDNDVRYFTDTSSSKKKIVQKAEALRQEYLNLIDDVMDGVFGDEDTMEKETKIDKCFSFMCVELFQAITQSSNKYFMQIALCENNIILILMILVVIAIDLKKDNVLLLLIRNIALICENNFVAQSLLFSGISGKMFVYLNENKPLLGTLAYRYTFSRSSKVVYIGPEVFETIHNSYKNLLKIFFDAEFNFEKLDKFDSEVDETKNESQTNDGDKVEGQLPTPTPVAHETRNYKNVGTLMSILSFNLFVEEVIDSHTSNST